MVLIQITVGNSTLLSRVIENVGNAVKDWTPALSQSATDLLEFIEGEVFDTEGGALDQPWQELSAPYAEVKAVRYPGAGILEATGTMRESFWPLVSPTMLTIGNDTPYFKFHQSSAPRFKLPRRPMLGISQQMKEMVIKNFQQQILDAAML